MLWYRGLKKQLLAIFDCILLGYGLVAGKAKKWKSANDMGEDPHNHLLYVI
jgi:hypothetical protein